jgi:hypothetical protein
MILWLSIGGLLWIGTCALVMALCTMASTADDEAPVVSESADSGSKLAFGRRRRPRSLTLQGCETPVHRGQVTELDGGVPRRTD